MTDNPEQSREQAEKCARFQGCGRIDLIVSLTNHAANFLSRWKIIFAIQSGRKSNETRDEVAKKLETDRVSTVMNSCREIFAKTARYSACLRDNGACFVLFVAFLSF